MCHEIAWKVPSIESSIRPNVFDANSGTTLDRRGLKKSTGKAMVCHASKGNRKRRSSENVISTDKAALLWMYCKEIAPFEPAFTG
jgi:hypothetical protein